MAGLAVHLLGRPRIERDGEPLPAPRGHKAWGLLTYLLCAERPPARSELVTHLFGEADDPLGALRWNLSALRRVLPGAELGGDPVRLAAPEGMNVDVPTVLNGSWREAIAVEGLGRELLEGMAFDTCPAFEIWLTTLRRHLDAAAEAVLHEAALARLGVGDAEGAVHLAGRLVRLNPLDENFQALLIRALAASGDGVEAARQVARCRELFARELGTEPSPAVATAAETVPATPTTGAVSGRAAAAAQLEAGEAAISAGAIDAGLQCLRRAVEDARTGRSAELEARGLVALGSALVHAARGRDEEAAAALHEGLALAGELELGGLAAAAARELGYVEFLRARYERAEERLSQAAGLAGDDPRERGHIASVLGSVRSDRAQFGEALDTLSASIELSRAAGDRRRVAYTTTMAGRVHLLRGDLDEAGRILEDAMAAVRAEGWTAFLPWPEALRGDVDMARGEIAAATDRYEHAFALGCQIGDPCWEGIAARGLGLVAAEGGDVERALDLLADARKRCCRLPDAYVWVEAYTLDALCAIAVEHDLPLARRWIEELATLAGRCGMRDLAASAYLHAGRLGDESALQAARLLAAGIDSPALARRLAS